jgi:arsenical pump membrane protein
MFSSSYVTPAVIAVAVATALCLIMRPFRLPEAVWAVLAAVILVSTGLVAPSEAFAGARKGLDVYLFLVGMMLLSELARKEGLFDWLAAVATGHANGSPSRLFTLIYGVGIVVTVFLSNDATAVVLTPAVYAACRAAKVKDPLPYLFICAFIANAASFVLPISNPANLVIFNGGRMPPLLQWLRVFTLPSLVSIMLTYTLLRWTQSRQLNEEKIAARVATPPLPHAAKVAGAGLVATALGLVAASAFGADLGLPTFIAGIATLVLVSVLNREAPLDVLKGVSWSVLPLVAGLFIIVQALSGTGLIAELGQALARYTESEPSYTAMIVGVVTGLVANAVNNLPAGLVAGSVAQAAHAPITISGAILVGIDLGPNLSVSGSLATILWLTALRREGISVSGLQFFKLGVVVMLPTLVATLAALVVIA